MPPLPRRSTTTSTALATRPRRAIVSKAGSRRPISELTAAAVRVNRKRAGEYRRLIQPWQMRALSYYDLVGECWNSAQFYSRSLKQVRLFVAERDENGELKETENEEVKGELARIQDPGGGGYSRLLDAYGRLMFLCGEGYFLVTNPDGDDESWEFVSSDELRINGEGSYTRFAAPSLPAQLLRDVPDTAYKPIGDEALVMRVWRPHPRYSALADSPVRAVLDLLEELVLLTLAVRARAKSRLAANGILFLPDGLSQAPLEAVGDEDPMLDPFLEDLIEQIVSPIENPGSAAAVAPAIIRGPDDLGEKIKLIQISNPLETYPEQGLRTEAVKRYAIGIEMPAEMLTGTGTVNHWGAWLIDEQAARQYIFPMCQDLCDNLTSVYLRPTLREANVADWERYVIGYDASAVVAHPDRAKDARELHDRLVISDKALRDANDFNDSDAPDLDELNRRIGVKLKDASLATGGEYDPGTTTQINADEEQTGEEGAPQSGAEVDAGAPEGIPEDAGDASSMRARTSTPERDALIGRVLGLCAAGVIRGRQLAGSRLRARIQHANGSLEMSLTPADELANVPNEELARALGVEWVRSHAGTEKTLVNGATAGIDELLRIWGYDEQGAAGLCDLVLTHAARTLYGHMPAETSKSIRSYVEALTPR